MVSDVNAELIVAKPIAGGYTWTLASCLGHMLRTAEERYGPRDASYTLLGVEFAAGGPQLWYPGDCRHIVIQLGLSCLDEPPRAYYQLAHECIHLLSPTGSRRVTVLEEGLATLFARAYLRNALGLDWQAVMPSYEEARQDVKGLLAQDGDAIKRLREVEPCLSRMTAELVLDFCPSVGRLLAYRLVREFER